MVCRADKTKENITMKKLVIAVAAVAIGIAANAASYSWATTKGYLYDGTGDSAAKITSGTAYLVLSSYAQSDLVSLFASNNGDAATTLATLQGNAAYLGTGTIGSNARMSGSGTTSATESITTYFVVFNGSNMYSSDTATSDYDGLAQAHDITFGTSMTSSSKALPSEGAYSGAGWYTAVPEPTSGLLMLLGMAGLALRRRRA